MSIFENTLEKQGDKCTSNY